MWKPCSESAHEWESIFTWCGRYRCRVCLTIGYRGLVIGVHAGNRRMDILPYKCPKCHGPTTKWRRKRAGEYRVVDGAQPCPSCAPAVQGHEHPA